MHVVAENYEQIHTHTHTHAHTHTRDNYNNPHCAHARRGLINTEKQLLAFQLQLTAYTLLHPVLLTCMYGLKTVKSRAILYQSNLSNSITRASLMNTSDGRVRWKRLFSRGSVSEFVKLYVTWCKNNHSYNCTCSL